MRKLKKLKSVRKARGMSQAEFARAVGTNQANICRWEQGKVRPKDSTLNRVAAALGVSAGDL